MTTEPTRIFEGNTFLAGDRTGNIDAQVDRSHGVFAWDTRFISRWVLKVDGRVPNVILASSDSYCQVEYWSAAGGTDADAVIVVIRRQAIGVDFTEQITVRNEGTRPIRTKLEVEVAADFADVLEVDGAPRKKGNTYRCVEGGRLILGYERGNFARETRIASSSGPNGIDRSLEFDLVIPPHGEWTTRLDAEFSLGPYWIPPAIGYSRGCSASPPGKDLSLWLQRTPTIRSSRPPLDRIYERSLIDLTGLRFNSAIEKWSALPAASAPRYMCIRGRDCLIASFQALPFMPGLAETSLHALADWQGSCVDSYRDEEPGKILEEIRFGELVAFEESPQSPYYGAADTTPLFLIVLDEYTRWTGDNELARGLERQARAALRWIDQFGDLNGDGYVDYRARIERTGLANQCWKNSPNSIVFADGSDSALPCAPCEIQGYVYDAKIRVARIARDIWNDEDTAQDLEDSAARLKSRFNRDYWNEARSCFGLAIDGRGRLVDSITSNIGHLLWSGIVDHDKAACCVEHLLSEEMFSGWGVRTMAQTEAGYNPLGSHTGTVWPHDNSIIAYGLARYGYRQEAGLIAAGILQAAAHFDGRLPDAFAGYARKLTRVPVEFPGACRPSAWAAGAPLLLLRALLGLEPLEDRLVVDPQMPEALGSVDLLGLSGPWGSADARSAAARSTCSESVEDKIDNPLSV